MALTEQKIADFERDLEDAAKIVNGGVNETVVTRLGQSVKTFARAIAEMIAESLPAEFNSLVGRVETLEEGGGIPATITNVKLINSIYFDAVNGNDNNDGKSIGGAVKTQTRMEELFVAGAYNDVQLLSDITLTGAISIRSAITLTFRRQNSNINPKIVLNNFRYLFWGVTVLQFLTVDIEMTSGQTGQAAFGFYGPGGLFVSTVDFIDSGSSANSDLFLNAYSSGLTATFANSPIAAVAGKVFAGVSAGEDPESRHGLKCNLGAV